MKSTVAILLILSLLSCGRNSVKREHLEIGQKGEVSVLLLGVLPDQDFYEEAESLGIKVEGSTVMRLTGDASKLKQLSFSAQEDFTFVIDRHVEIQGESSFPIDSSALYQAKKDFGLLEFWRGNKIADGRGVVVGVLDDGISPNQSAFRVTTTGERKLLKKGGNSSLSTFDLMEAEEGFTVTIQEKTAFSGDLDLNGDGITNNWIGKVSSDGKTICLDLNVNSIFEEDECKGNFSLTGDFFYLPKKPTLSIMAEVDLETKKLRLTQPEVSSHGEGVAAVMAGHQIGNLMGFDGVAPGAQIVDYDLSEFTNIPSEKDYTIGKILTGLEWLAMNGAEVLNVSYSLFFTNASSQTFMARALQKLVDKYNVVICFSAGNNGPGLGSLNRRLAYPSSVLVAGAFVSKELDERVHGVSGIPDEGRVVYYSSRGPGVQGVGPLLISPLSSLTPSTPDAGFMAFNGTSSASPALAGAAAVLLSAIKQENLKFDATTLVHALRLSGKKLKSEPFVTQGYGLPQVQKALSLYKELLRGKNFNYLNHAVNRGGRDGTTAEGIFLRRSQAQDLETYRINLTGVLSKAAPSAATTDLLIPVEIRYSKGISGASELWVAASESKFYLDVNVDEVLGEDKEAFGEINIISKLNGAILATIPVTVINDQRPRNFFRTELEVSSQEGARLHLDIPAGVQGIKVTPRVKSGESRFLNTGAYSPDYIRIKSQGMSEFILPTPKSGHYQITLQMVGGTKRKAVVEYEIEEIQLNLLSSTSAADKGKISISNLSGASLQGDLVLTPVPEVIKSSYYNQKSSVPEIALTLKKGNYEAEIKPAGSYDLSYFYSSCTIRHKTETTELPLSETIYTVPADKEMALIFRCVPFDFGTETQENLNWVIKVLKRGEETKLRLDVAAKSKKDLTLPTLAPGNYQVEFLNPLSQDRIVLGRIELL
jgi:subtilisin family serine protease